MKIFIILITCIFLSISCTESSNNSESTTEAQQDAVENVENADNTETAEVPEWNNTHCPVMEDKVKEDGGSTMYQGKLVRFCCPKCIKKFHDNTEKYHETLVSYSEGAQENAENHDDHENHDSEHNH